MKSFLLLFSVVLGLTVTINSEAADHSGFFLQGDIYGAHSSIMPFKGYQDDLSATLYFRYADWRLMPFIRGVSSNYHYLLPTATDYIDDQRTSAGAGADFRIFDVLKFRFISESIKNKLADTTYTQESYGLIYNQYLQFEYIEFSNYAEAFMIPRISTKTADTFVRIQALKSFYLTQTATVSNAVYPFATVRGKYNDDANFGLTGQNGSVGAGYKFYAINDAQTQRFEAVLEGHSIVFQSKDYDSDKFQIVGVLQWIIN